MATIGKNDKNVSLVPATVPVISQDEKFRKDFMKIVEKNLSNPDFGIETLCNDLYISRATLFRMVKKVSTKSPMGFIRSCRLERAAQLLRENFGNVTEVAEEVGFRDQFYFSKCFHKKFKQPPKEYQLEKLRKKREKDEYDEKRLLTNLLPDVTIETLDREILARGAQMLAAKQSVLLDQMSTPQEEEIMKHAVEYHMLHTTLNEALRHFSTNKLIIKLRDMIEEEKSRLRKNRVYIDDRLDIFDITDSRVRMNAGAVAAVCMRSDLLSGDDDFFKLKVKTYGPAFHLHQDEMFFNQPIAAGPMCTGVLVGQDVIATVSRFANEKNVTGLRFIFDFVIQTPGLPVEKIPHIKIFKGIEVIEKIKGQESDWLLIKLNQNVTDREIVTLSKKEAFPEQPVYTIGHPCGLPLKYAPGAEVRSVSGSHFNADLDVYGGNSGSPVFCAETHELIGLVSRNKPMDFRWTEEGMITIRYSKSGPEYIGIQCSRVSGLERYVVKQ